MFTGARLSPVNIETRLKRLLKLEARHKTLDDVASIGARHERRLVCKRYDDRVICAGRRRLQTSKYARAPVVSRRRAASSPTARSLGRIVWRELPATPRE